MAVHAPNLAGAGPGTGCHAVVSLYAKGKLRGCFGSDEGEPNARVSRAFLRALADTRFGTTTATERAGLVGQISYIVRPRALQLDDVYLELDESC